MRISKWLGYAGLSVLLYAGSMLCSAPLDDYRRQQKEGIRYNFLEPLADCSGITGIGNLRDGDTLTLKDKHHGKPIDVARYKIRIMPGGELPFSGVQEYSVFDTLELHRTGDGISEVVGKNADGSVAGRYIITANSSGDSVAVGFGPLRCTDFFPTEASASGSSWRP